MLNSSAPLYIGKFDYIVGNPPWIKWEFLDEGYKQRLETLYLDIYELFSHSGMEASLGYAHDDISVVFMFVVMDKYLKNDGLLSFVVKQTLYKSQASSELRKFKIEKNGDSDSPLVVGKQVANRQMARGRVLYVRFHDWADVKYQSPY